MPGDRAPSLGRPILTVIFTSGARTTKLRLLHCSGQPAGDEAPEGLPEPRPQCQEQALRAHHLLQDHLGCRQHWLQPPQNRQRPRLDSNIPPLLATQSNFDIGLASNDYKGF